MLKVITNSFYAYVLLADYVTTGNRRKNGVFPPVKLMTFMHVANYPEYDV